MVSPILTYRICDVIHELMNEKINFFKTLKNKLKHKAPVDAWHGTCDVSIIGM